ncbi:MAG: L,D-transpeptidase [Sarcina sp.]
MSKKLIVFIIVLVLGISFIGVKRVNIQRVKKRGLTEVFSEIKCESRMETLKKANALKEKGRYSLARRIIEDNIDNPYEDAGIIAFLDNVNDVIMKKLKYYSIQECLKNKELAYYYEKITPRNIKNLELNSDTNRFIFVNIQEQLTSVYINKNDKWTLEKEFICATGEENTPTPPGVYKTGIKGEWFYRTKFDKGAKYYISFIKDEYLLHSTPYYKDKKTIWEDRLGVPMSNGCIRHSTENQKWLYDNIKEGTKIIIY